MLSHAIRVDAEAGYALRLRLQVRVDMHARRVPPEEERFVGLRSALHEIDGAGRDFFVNGLHALPRQRAGILDLAVGARLDDTAWSELLGEFSRLRVIRMLRLFLGIQVIQVSEKLVEAMVRRQMLIEIAEVVLAVLGGHITVVLEQSRYGRVFFG